MTIANPIITAVAREATAMDGPISNVSVIAPLVTGVAILTISWAIFDVEPYGVADLPAGIGASMMSRAPDSIVRLPPMADIEGLSIATAWRHGAWNICRTIIAAGYDGPLPPTMAGIADAAREQGYVSWHWKPKMRGPEIRAKQKRADTTLDKWTLGRDGNPPETRRPPFVAGRSILIKLGDDGRRRPHRATKAKSWQATDRQRGYLRALLRKAGEDDALPDDLDKRTASAWIDRLIGEAPVPPPRKPEKRSLRMTANQRHLIDRYLRQLMRPCLPVDTTRLMTYDKAQAMIAELSAILTARTQRGSA